MVVLLLAGILSGCYSPPEQEATRRAWAERDADQARECFRHGRRLPRLWRPMIGGGGEAPMVATPALPRHLSGPAQRRGAGPPSLKGSRIEARGLVSGRIVFGGCHEQTHVDRVVLERARARCRPCLRGDRARLHSKEQEGTVGSAGRI